MKHPEAHGFLRRRLEAGVRARWGMNNALNSLQGSIHQASESFNELSRGGQCAFMALSLSTRTWTQSVIDRILQHGDGMYLHALSNNFVPDWSALNVKYLPIVTTCPYGSEWAASYGEYFQGIAHVSFVGKSPYRTIYYLRP